MEGRRRPPPFLEDAGPWLEVEEVKEEPLCFDVEADPPGSPVISVGLPSPVQEINENDNRPIANGQPNSPSPTLIDREEDSPSVSPTPQEEDGDEFYLMSPPDIKKEEEEEDVVFDNPDIELPWERYSPERLPSVSPEVKELVDEDVTPFHSESIKASVRCAVCLSLFDSYEELASHHEATHSGGRKHCTACTTVHDRRPYERCDHPDFCCSRCEMRFTSELGLRRHEKIHIISCADCTLTFDTSNELYVHLVRSHGYKHTCRMCLAITRSQQHLSHHFKRCHPKTCFVCLATFGTPQETVAHRLCTHIKYMCRHCDMRFGLRADLLAHKKRSHRNLHCDACKRSFKNWNELLYHKLIEHPKFVCEICNARCSTQASLEAHLKSHNAYQCVHCNEGFQYKNQLARHECDRSLDDNSAKVRVPPVLGYACNVCRETKSSLEDLKKHRCKATASIPIIECPISKAGCESVPAYRKHYAKIHAKFKCSFCDIRLSTKRDRKVHEATHAGYPLPTHPRGDEQIVVPDGPSDRSTGEIPPGETPGLTNSDVDETPVREMETSIRDLEEPIRFSGSADVEMPADKRLHADVEVVVEETSEMDLRMSVHEKTISDFDRLVRETCCDETQPYEAEETFEVSSTPLQIHLDVSVEENENENIEMATHETTTTDLETTVDEPMSPGVEVVYETYGFRIRPHETRATDLELIVDEPNGADAEAVYKTPQEGVEIPPHETRAIDLEMTVDEPNSVGAEAVYETPQEGVEIPPHETRAIDLEMTVDEPNSVGAEIVNKTTREGLEIPPHETRAIDLEMTVDEPNSVGAEIVNKTTREGFEVPPHETRATDLEIIIVDEPIPSPEGLAIPPHETRATDMETTANEPRPVRADAKVDRETPRERLETPPHETGTADPATAVRGDDEMLWDHEIPTVRHETVGVEDCGPTGRGVVETPRALRLRGETLRDDTSLESHRARHEAGGNEQGHTEELASHVPSLLRPQQTHNDADGPRSHVAGRRPALPRRRGKTFGTSEELAAHGRSLLRPSHGGPCRHACRTCGLDLDTEADLRAHAASHLERHRCTICRHEAASRDELATHFETHRVRNYCKVCSMELSSERELSAHDRLHSALVCQFCGKNFPTRATLGNHRWAAHLKLRCHVCGFSCKSSATRARHLERHAAHAFKCATCGRAFATNALRNGHKRDEHLTGACEVCGLRLRLGRPMRDHGRTHARPVDCAMCGAIFHTQGKYQQHCMTEHF